MPGGRPRTLQRNQIVEENDILTSDQILMEEWTIPELSYCFSFQDNDNLIKWLAKHRLIRNS